MATDAFEDRWYAGGDENYVNMRHWMIATHSDNPKIVKQAKADLAKHEAGLKCEAERRKADDPLWEERRQKERRYLVQRLTQNFNELTISAENLLREHPDLAKHPKLSPVLKHLGL